MNNVDEMVEHLCPAGVEHRTLGQVGEFIRGHGLQKADLRNDGVPAVHYGQIHTFYGVWATETKSFTDEAIAAKLRHARPGDLLIATTSEDDNAVAKATAWLGEAETVLSGDAYIYRHELDPKYVAYFFNSTSFQDQKRRFISGTKVRRISGQSLSKIRIPVPPMEVQWEIVAILDQFTQLEAELKAELEAELEARRCQYDHYRRKIFSFESRSDVKWSTLGEISSRVSSGGTPPTGRSDYYGGNIPWVRTQEVDFGYITTTEKTITEIGLKNSSAKWIPANSVIVAMYGATAAKVAINSIPVTTNQACCNLEINPAQSEFRYVFHWISCEYESLKSLGEGSQSNLNAKKVKNYPIPLPPLEEQRRIVRLLDNFDALVNDLSIGLPAELGARRKQYEHYRDRLFTFKEAAA
ncbi:restriction endonuclease subunit S [Glycomyces sp. L485]|uniref:restriction endonuclease subunit S n=1 Tax=Glycomyces sp. L485 TaxID=2909235 RepID=UPI001F4A1E2D|nr:restriction endonuclease subunit S [Glycomyces sp. L485]MCH7229710.1 restriction endonuclease subunit S [Glycomyces sp. L485]